MYDPAMVEPMRKELTSVGFKEMQTADEVDQHLADHSGTSLVMVNSVCGCAAGSARPGVSQAVENSVKPDELLTVFAGQDAEATNHARSYFHGYAPSSPSIALLKDGEVVFMLERMDIEGRSAEEISGDLKFAFNRHCADIDADMDVTSLYESFPQFKSKLQELLKRDSGKIGEGLEADAAKSLIEEIEDLLDAEPDLIPVTFSPEGAEQFKKIRVEQGNPDSGIALTNQGLDFKSEAGPDDVEFESEGIKIFVEKTLMKRYNGRKIHFSDQGPNGGGFSIQ